MLALFFTAMSSLPRLTMNTILELLFIKFTSFCQHVPFASTSVTNTHFWINKEDFLRGTWKCIHHITIYKTYDHAILEFKAIQFKFDPVYNIFPSINKLSKSADDLVITYSISWDAELSSEGNTDRWRHSPRTAG